MIGIAAQCAGHVEAVEGWQREVEKHDVGPVAARDRHRGLAVGGGDDGKAGALEVVAEDAHDLGLVIDDQYGPHRAVIVAVHEQVNRDRDGDPGRSGSSARCARRRRLAGAGVPVGLAVPGLHALVETTEPVLTAPAAAPETVTVTPTEAEDARQHEAADEGECGEARVVGGDTHGDGAAHRDQAEQRSGWTEVHGDLLVTPVDTSISIAPPCEADVNAIRRSGG